MGGIFRGLGGDINWIDSGTFVGGSGNDTAGNMDGGTFIGGGGPDDVTWLYAGRFVGGPWKDRVKRLGDGKFFGNKGADRVTIIQWDGLFHGGPGRDVLVYECGGQRKAVEVRKGSGPC